MSRLQKFLSASVAMGALVFGAAAYAQTVDEGAADETAAYNKERQPAAARANEEVVVTASGFEQRITEAPASISVLPRATIQENRGNSIGEVLREVEGVDVGAEVDKTGGLSVNIRGMGSDYTLILVDGRRQNAAGNVTPNGFTSTANSFLPPTSAIERVEVVRGPVSTLYGSDAMGGVVNIITRKVGAEWGGSISANTTIQFDDAYGDLFGGNFYLNGPLATDLLGLSVRGSLSRRAQSHILFEDIDGNPTEITGFNGRSPTEYEIWSLGGRLSLTPTPDHDIWLDAQIDRQWYDNSKGQLGTNTAAGGYSDELEFNREEYVLAHTWRLDFGQLDSTLSRGTTETVGRIVPPGVPNAGNPRTLEATNTIFDTKLYSQWDNHGFTIGGQYWDAEMVDGVAASPFEHQQWALYAEDEWRLIETLALTVGLRYDNHSVFGSHYSPRAYLVWNATEQLTVKGGVSRGFKTPRLEQLASGIVGFGGQGTIPLLGSPGLTPETSTSYEVGVYYDNDDWFRGHVTLFHNTFEDKIATGIPLANCAFGLTEAQYLAAQPFGPSCYDAGYFPRSATFGQSVNIDEAETQGVEVSARFRFAEDWQFSLNYTFTESEQKSGEAKGLPLTNTPKHMVNGNLRWQAQDDLSLWLRGEYRSSRYRGVGIPQDELGNFSEQTIFSIGGSYDLTPEVTLNATLYNLFDEDFSTYLPYNTAPNTIAYAPEFSIIEEPRRLWVSLTVDF